MPKRILIISPVPSHPPTSGNRARILMLGQCIRDLGHELHFAHIDRENGDGGAMAEHWGRDRFYSLPYRRSRPRLRRLASRVQRILDREAPYRRGIDDWYDTSLDGALTALAQSRRFDVVIVEYVFFSRALRCFPRQTLRVVDTHDVFSDRHRPFLARCAPYSGYSTSPRQERRGLLRADVVLAIQDLERALFQQMTNRPVLTVGHIVPLVPPDPQPPGAKLIFIGSACETNRDAVKFLLGAILPRIRAAVPGAKLFVAGGVTEMISRSDPCVERLGTVQSLRSVYAGIDIVVTPIRIGTGLKVKNIEALAHGKPVVTTSLGAAGLQAGDASGLLVADEPAEFAATVAAILRDPRRHAALAAAAYRFAADWNRRQRSALGEVLESRPRGRGKSRTFVRTVTRAIGVGSPRGDAFGRGRDSPLPAPPRDGSDSPPGRGRGRSGCTGRRPRHTPP